MGWDEMGWERIIGSKPKVSNRQVKCRCWPAQPVGSRNGSPMRSIIYLHGMVLLLSVVVVVESFVSFVFFVRFLLFYIMSFVESVVVVVVESRVELA